MFRSKEAVMWNIAFPLFMFFLYVTLFSGIYPEQISSGRAVSDNLAKILTMAILSGGLFSVGLHVSVMKEKGVLRRYKVTPVKPVTIVLGTVFTHSTLMILNACLLTALAIIAYRAEIMGGILEYFVTILIGIIVFGSLGLCVAGLSKTNQSAVGIANILFMPMIFLSGITIPAFLFPEWLTKFANLLPGTHLYKMIQSVVFYGNSLIESSIHIIVLLAFGLVFVIIASFLSRWN
jgi:ABC-2 type transport system permease protein